MSLLFHPKTLELMAKFKKYGKKEDLVSCLSLILDNSVFIDISFIHNILFSFASPNLDESLNAIIQKNFYKVRVHRTQKQQVEVNSKADIKHIDDNTNNYNSLDLHENYKNNVFSNNHLEKHLDMSQTSMCSSVYNFVDIFKQGITQELNSSKNNECDQYKDEYICLYKHTKTSRQKQLLMKNRKNSPSFLGDLSNQNFINNLELSASTDLEFSDFEHIPDSFFTSIAIYDIECKDDTELHSIVADNSAYIANRENNVTESNTYLDQNNTSPSRLASSLNLDNIVTSNLDNLDSSVNSDLKKRRKIQKPIQSNTLNFNKLQSSYQSDLKRFEPLDLKHASFVYDRNNIVLDTLRKRDDLINPVQLQFIKHFDQIRPPIYQRRGAIKKIVFSYQRIEGILSYEEDSSEDWEEANDTQIEESTEEIEESESCTEEDDDWIEADSEEEVVDTTRNNKKPMLFYKDVQIQTYLVPSTFKNCPLVPTDTPSDELKRDIFDYIKDTKIDIQEKEQTLLNLFNVKLLPS